MKILLLIWLMLLGATLHFWFASYVLKCWHMVWQGICEYAKPDQREQTPATKAEWDAHWAHERELGAKANARLCANLGIGGGSGD